MNIEITLGINLYIIAMKIYFENAKFNLYSLFSLYLQVEYQ